MAFLECYTGDSGIVSTTLEDRVILLLREQSGDAARATHNEDELGHSLLGGHGFWQCAPLLSCPFFPEAVPLPPVPHVCRAALPRVKQDESVSHPDCRATQPARPLFWPLVCFRFMVSAPYVIHLPKFAGHQAQQHRVTLSPYW